MIEVIPSWIVTAELNDGPITLRCSREDLDAVIRCVQHSNARWFRAEREPDDWQQWPRLGNVAWERERTTEIAELRAENERLRGECEKDMACLKSVAEDYNGELTALKAELERTQTALGQANADLMGCRDGALVRDLRAENARLKAEVDEYSSIVVEANTTENKLRAELENQSRLLGLVIAERDAAKERSNIASAERQHAQQPPRRE